MGHFIFYLIWNFRALPVLLQPEKSSTVYGFISSISILTGVFQTNKLINQ